MMLLVHFSGENYGLISLVLVLVNDCRSDGSPVNISDSASTGLTALVCRGSGSNP